MACNGLLSSGFYTGLAMHTWMIHVWEATATLALAIGSRELCIQCNFKALPKCPSPICIKYEFSCLNRLGKQDKDVRMGDVELSSESKAHNI